MKAHPDSTVIQSLFVQYYKYPLKTVDMRKFDQLGLYREICRSTDIDVATKQEKLVTAREFYKSDYHKWLDSKLLGEIKNLRGDVSRHGNTVSIYVLREMETFLAKQFVDGNQKIDYADLHQRIAKKINSIANDNKVRRYSIFRDNLLAIIGVFLAIPLALAPLLFPKYRATFFESQNRKQVLSCAAEFKKLESNRVQSAVVFAKPS